MTSAGSEQELDEEYLRARDGILDAAASCFERFGVLKTTVKDVAELLGVSRGTVYRYFETRDALVIGVLEREAIRYIVELFGRHDPVETFADRIVEAMALSVEAFKNRPYFSIYVRSELAAPPGAAIQGATSMLLDKAHAALRPLFEEAARRGEVRTDLNSDEMADWCFRIFLSLVLTGGVIECSSKDLRRLLRTYLIPGLVPPSEE